MRIPAFPQPLARLVARLPSFPASFAFSRACNLLAWPALRDLDWSEVSGRTFCVQVKDVGARVYFSLQADGFRAVQECAADVTFTATAEDFVRLTLRLEDPDTLFFNRRLMIEGNTDLGLRVKNMLDGMDLDEIGRELPFPLRNGFTLLRARVQQELMAQPAA